MSPTPPNSTTPQSSAAPVPGPVALLAALEEQVEQVVVGGAPLARLLLLGVTAGGHVLLEGVPGTAKTLLARTFSLLLDLPFRRLQLTPDLLPADITGTMVLQGLQGPPVFRPGPVFTGVLLADEANRAPPRTQAALLEAMEERQVTVDGVTHQLNPAFTVVATVNSAETEGAWPMPEAQSDRFLLRVRLTYPDKETEWRLLERVASHGEPRAAALPALRPLLDAETLANLRKSANNVLLGVQVRHFILELVHELRADPRTRLGPSPRATVQLAAACRARALYAGRDHVLPDDVAALLEPVLAHRISLHSGALLNEESADSVIRDVRAQVEVPR